MIGIHRGRDIPAKHAVTQTEEERFAYDIMKYIS